MVGHWLFLVHHALQLLPPVLLLSLKGMAISNQILPVMNGYFINERAVKILSIGFTNLGVQKLCQI